MHAEHQDRIRDTEPGGGIPPSLGPYRVEAELGRGGMGVVVRACDTRTGARVALKLLHPWLGAASSTAARFRLEAEAGIALEHENVVRTFELATDGSFEFLVMEYVQGKTLRELLDELGQVPESLLREIARQVACGLEAIHRRDILHRDLKPENVLITDDKRVRIMDLGIAKLFGSSAQITAEGQFVGSIAYAAPERFHDESVGPTSDLYSLGVLLYELAAGTNPFRHDSPAQTIHAHLNVVAPPLQLVVPSVSRFFSGVVASLIEKAPENRIASAHELEEILVAGEQSRWWEQRIATGPRRPMVPVERAAALQGRQGELAQLAEAWSAAASGAGTVVVLSGDAGTGKTRLVAEFLRSLESSSVEILYGGFSPAEGFAALVDSFARPGMPLPVEDVRRPAEVADALVRNLRSIARTGPVVWVVEDLHFASPEAERVVLAVARSIRGYPVLLLVTRRDDRPGRWVDVEPKPRAIALTPLRTDAIAGLLHDQFRDAALAAHLAPMVARRSDGIPLFALGIVRALTEQGIVRRGESGFELAGRPEDLVVPDALRAHVAARIAALDADARRVLDAAATVGSDFDPTIVAAVLEQPLVRVLQRLAEIERYDGLVRSVGRDYQFSHHLDYEVLYAELAPRLREEFHARVGDVLLAAPAAGGDPVEVRREAAVDHHLRGARPQAVLADDLLEKTLRFCQDRSGRGAQLAKLALDREGLLAGVPRGRIALWYAQFLDVLGRREENAAAIDEAVAIAEATGDPLLTAKIRIGQTTQAIARADMAGAVALAAEGRQAALAAGHDSTTMLVESIYGLALGWAHEFEASAAAFERGTELATRAGNDLVLGQLLNNRSLVLVAAGDLNGSLALLERSLEIGKRFGGIRAQSHGHGNVGMTLVSLGRYAEAEPHLERQYELSIVCSEPRSEAMATSNLAYVRAAQGYLADALSMMRRRGELSERIGDRAGVVHKHVGAASILIDLGDLEHARAEIDAGLERARAIGSTPLAVRLLASASRAALAEDDLAAARRHADEARDTAAGSELFETVARAALNDAIVRERAGEREASLAALDEVASQLDRTQLPLLIAPIRVRRALLAGDDAGARAVLEEYDDRLEATTRMELHFHLHLATGDAIALAAARDTLQVLLERAPAERRSAMRTVSWHRAILAAAGDAP